MPSPIQLHRELSLDRLKSQFSETLKNKRLLLVFDVDGTIAPFNHTHPDQVRVDPEIVNWLHEIAAQDPTAILINTGRPIELVKQFFVSTEEKNLFALHPKIGVIGNHGMTLQTGAQIYPIAPIPDEARAYLTAQKNEAAELVRKLSLPDGLKLSKDDKGNIRFRYTPSDSKPSIEGVLLETKHDNQDQLVSFAFHFGQLEAHENQHSELKAFKENFLEQIKTFNAQFNQNSPKTENNIATFEVANNSHCVFECGLNPALCNKATALTEALKLPEYQGKSTFFGFGDACKPGGTDVSFLKFIGQQENGYAFYARHVDALDADPALAPLLAGTLHGNSDMPEIAGMKAFVRAFPAVTPEAKLSESQAQFFQSNKQSRKRDRSGNPVETQSTAPIAAPQNS